MKAYVMTTGVLFGLLAMAHVWRIFAEGQGLATNPWFVLVTVLNVSTGFLPNTP